MKKAFLNLRGLPVFLALLLVPALLPAQAPAWTPTGPFGGNFNLAAHPTAPGVLYASGSGGVFRTRDAGASWQWLPRPAGLRTVAIDPTQPRTLYAASSPPAARVFKSTDEGVRWRAVSRNLPAQLNITRLVVDPARPSRLYLTATTGGVWRSGDGGATWQSVSQGLPDLGNTNVPVLVVPRQPGGTAFAGTFGSGLFRTRNAGGSWELVRGGLPVGGVAALAVSPSDPRTLYVSIQDLGVFRSRDGGNSWVPAGTPVAEDVEISALAVHPRSPLTVYAGSFGDGVFRSTDGGGRWTPTTPPPSPFVTVLTLDASAALYAGLSPIEDVGGVLRSADGGASWERRNRGLLGLDTLSVAVDSADPDNLVTSVSGLPLFRSASAAARWVLVRDGLPPSRFTGVVLPEVIAGGPGTFYFVDPSRGPGRTWKSSDAGRTWAPLPFPEGTPQIVRADPLDPETLYALSLNGTVSRLFRSEDGGATWTLLPDLPSTCTVFDLEVARTSATAPAVLYLAGSRSLSCRTLNQPAVYRSTDGGATWTAADAGLPGAGVYQIAVDPRDPRVVFAGLGVFSSQTPGVWKSTDSGASWRVTGLDDRIIRSLAASPGEPGVLWAGALGGGIYRSTDFGETWQESGGGLPLEVFGFAFAPGRVYAATWNGVWVLDEE